MNFSEVAITIVSAILLGALFWPMGTPPAEEQFSVANEHQHLERPAVVKATIVGCARFRYA